MTEVDYYWYHHMMPSKDREAIQQAINNHDFKTFIKYYKIYNSKGIQKGQYHEEIKCFCPVIYLPNTALYTDKRGFTRSLDILCKGNFNRITSSESECG